MKRRVPVSPWLASVLLGAAPAQAGLRQELLVTPAPAAAAAPAKAPAAEKPAPAKAPAEKAAPAKAPAEKPAASADKGAPAAAKAPAAEKPAPAAAKAPAAEKPAPAAAKAPTPAEGAAARPRKRERPLPLAEQVRILSTRVEALQALEAQLKALSAVEARVAQLEGEARDARAALRRAQLAASPWQSVEPTVQVGPGVRLHLRGYADIGLFVPLGDRLSFVRDDGLFHPERLGDAATVFIGDPWAVPVNAQGDAAALVSSTSSGVRPDSIAVAPRPSFLANMGNVGVLAALGDQVHVGLNLNIEPRSGQLGSPGDLFALDLVYALWRPLRGRDLEIYAGKMESNFGVEWRTRMAPDRVGVTPSLLSRFTVGTPIGLRVRGTTLGVLGYDLALTNGGTTTERFGQLHSELDRNIFKSASARVSLGKAFLAEDTNMGLPFFLEVGASGQVGAQDGQPDNGVIHWQIGADVRAAVGGLGVRFEALHVSANGDRAPAAPWVRASGLYAEVWYQLRCVQALLRFDLLRGEIASAGDLYLMDSARVSAALRVDITRHVLAKLEYQHYEDRGPADVRGDLLTSALVLRF